MMLAIALTQAAAPPPPASDEVTVIGQRLKAWRGRVSTTLGITTCKTEVSTGDRAIDAIGCTALRGCWSEHRPAYAAALKAKDKPATIKVEAMLGDCLKTRRDALVSELAERRAGARVRS